MPKNNNVISREKAEVFDAMGIPYVGYVKGVGYQSLHAFALGSCYFQNSNYCIPHFQMVIDSSSEEKIKSLKIDSDDLIDKLVKTDSNGGPTINMGHGKYSKLSNNCEIVAKIIDGERFMFGYRDRITGKEEITSGKLTELEYIFGDSEFVSDIQGMTLSTTPLGEINLVGPVSQPLGGGNDWIDPIFSFSSKVNGGIAVATVIREVIEWEYIRQARINRHIARNYSLPVRHSMRAIKAVGKFTGVASMAISWVDFYYNRSTGNFVQAVANTGLVFVRVNPVTGIILGIADVTGASDFVYDKIGDAIDNIDSSNAHQDVLMRGNLCFPGDMKVLMDCGEYKRIDEIVIGDVVMSYDFDTETLNPTVVKRVDSPYHHEMVYLRFSKKIEIRSTQDHPIWIEGKGWASVKNDLSSLRYKLDVHSLEEGDKCIVYVNGRKKVVKLKRIEYYDENQKTYNLTWLENGISYIVNGIIVSSESNAIND